MSATSTAALPDLALTTKGTWATRGACRHADVDMFPDENPRHRSPAAAVAAAKGVCAGCPVTAECLAYALETREEHGVWGGTTATERGALRRRERKATARRAS